MPESIHVFWALVAVLAVAAGCNHGWHHLRGRHLSSRLTRATYRYVDARVLVVEPGGRVADSER